MRVARRADFKTSSMERAPRKTMVCIILGLRVSGGVLGFGSLASSWSDMLVWPRPKPGRSMPSPLRVREKLR